MLGQINSVSPQHLQESAVLLIVAVSFIGTLMSIVVGIVMLVRGNRTTTTVTPQPFNVQLEQKLEEKLVSKEQCALSHQGTITRIQRLESDVNAMARQSEDRVGKLHGRIDDLVKAVAGMNGTLTQFMKEMERR